MQATLVSHYGEKPGELASYITRCQHELTNLLASAFTPYEITQVHGTIIGLEGCRKDDLIENTNFRKYRQKVRHVAPYELLTFLRSPSVPTIDIQIGGYKLSADYGFLSKGKLPYMRSFSIQGHIAVAMGWPADRTNALDGFRRLFNQLNALHKWHKSESDIDNDFFLVLGHVNRDTVSDALIADTEACMRQVMASSVPITVNVDRSSLRLVFYLDTQLPITSSYAHAVDDATLAPEDFLRWYDKCGDDPKQ